MKTDTSTERAEVRYKLCLDMTLDEMQILQSAVSQAFWDSDAGSRQEEVFETIRIALEELEEL